jgi:hypothetical protein
MRLRINDPALAPTLVGALNETDCLAAQTRGNLIDVIVPWVVDGDTARRALTELEFFVRAWSAGYPGCLITIDH